jgi:hypothetical protein
VPINLPPILANLLPSPEFTAAAQNAVLSNSTPFVERNEPQSQDEANGAKAGDWISVIIGLGEIAGGSSAAEGGTLILFGSGGVGAPIAVPAIGVGIAAVETGVFTISSAVMNLNNPTVAFGKKKSNKSGQEKGSDTPSWAKGMKPNTGEKPTDFAKRLMDAQKGKGNWKEGPGTEYNELKKYAERLK